MRTYSAPPSMATAPSAAPIQRSMTEPSNAAPIGQTTPSSGLFSGRGLFAGLPLASLARSAWPTIFGYGIFGGMAGFASIGSALMRRRDGSESVAG